MGASTVLDIRVIENGTTLDSNYATWPDKSRRSNFQRKGRNKVPGSVSDKPTGATIKSPLPFRKWQPQRCTLPVRNR